MMITNAEGEDKDNDEKVMVMNMKDVDRRR